MTRKRTNNRVQKNPKDFGLRYGNQKYNEKAEWINNMTRELEGLEESPKADIHLDLLKTTQKYQTGKRPAMMEDVVSRNSPLFMTD